MFLYLMIIHVVFLSHSIVLNPSDRWICSSVTKTRCQVHEHERRTSLSVMGNNLQALRTAKALTKHLTANDSFVTTNSTRDVGIERQNGHSSTRPSMSPESAGGVTLQTNHKRYSTVKMTVLSMAIFLAEWYLVSLVYKVGVLYR